jgi:MOSC domain-containing protein YiiM
MIKIGDAILEIGAHCHPCSRMEKALGKGALLAMYNRGGYCASVVQGGLIKVGDSVRVTQLQRELF